MNHNRRLRKAVMTTAIALMLGISVFAQEVTRGTLKSPSGEPLAGATITIKGTNRSVVTDANGNFSINAPSGTVLVISSVGMAPKEITVTGTEINETLQEILADE